MPTTVVPKIGNLEAVGIGLEATYGSAATRANWEPVTSCSLDVTETGLFYPKTAMAIRDLKAFPLYGQEKIGGTIEGPLFPNNGIALVVAAIGNDSAQAGTASGTVKNGTLASAIKGATSLTYTVTNASAAPANGEYLQIGPAVGQFGTSAGLPTGATFVTKITTVAGTTSPYTLTVPALPAAVASNAVAQVCIAPFYHKITPQNTLSSFSVERALGDPAAAGTESQLFTGAMVNKLGLKLPTTNNEASFTTDMVAQAAAVVTSPTSPTIDSVVPWVFSEGALSIGGVSVTQANNIELDIDNALKADYTLNGTNDLNFLTATSRDVSGKCSVIYHNLDDTDWGFWKRAVPDVKGNTPVTTTLSLTLTHGTGEIFYLTFPKVSIAKNTRDVKVGDTILETLELNMAYDFTATNSISGFVANATNTQLV